MSEQLIGEVGAPALWKHVSAIEKLEGNRFPLLSVRMPIKDSRKPPDWVVDCGVRLTSCSEDRLSVSEPTVTVSATAMVPPTVAGIGIGCGVK